MQHGFVFPNHGHQDHDSVKAKDEEGARQVVIGAESLEAEWLQELCGKRAVNLNAYVLAQLMNGVFELRISEVQSPTRDSREARREVELGKDGFLKKIAPQIDILRAARAAQNQP